MVPVDGSTQQRVTLSVRPRGKPIERLPEEVKVFSTGSAEELYKQLATQCGLSVHRLRITKGSDGSLVSNSKAFPIQSTGLKEQSTIYVKDLGPQMAWQTVFLIEYAGPLLIHPLLYSSLPSPRPYFLQTLTFALVMIHFVKRELETLFIHRFSAATMPAFNVFRNSAHYWLLSGLNMAYWVYVPSAAAARENNVYITSLGLILFIAGELGNLSNHITLRNLRSSGGTERGIPRGLGFDLVTCPNYMFEATAWVGIVLISWSLSTVLFAAIAIAQMAIWAKKKEAKYRKEFGAKYQRKRYVMIPGVF